MRYRHKLSCTGWSIIGFQEVKNSEYATNSYCKKCGFAVVIE